MKNFALTLSFLSISTVAFAQSFELVNDFESQSELINSTGVAVADYDLDGDLDIYIVASEQFDETNPLTWSRLLRNDGDIGYTDVTNSANLINQKSETLVGVNGSKMGASWGDYDNDGYPDIFLTNYGLDELWHNKGDGTFENMTAKADVAGCRLCYSTTALWWDYDNDADLDLYISDWRRENRFYRNDGNHSFTDISELTLLNDKRHTFSSLPIDINEDGLLDLYIINDAGENRFFWNHGDDIFEEATKSVGLTNGGNGMGIDVCDFNNDGFFDIYVTNIYPYLPNPFFVNRGISIFNDRANHYGIDNTGWGWGARFFDADHDLDEDLYVVNGFSSPVAQGDRNNFFVNDDKKFTDMSSELAVNSENWGMGLEVFDYDSDGDLDMLVANRGAHLDLYQNNQIETKESSNWIQIQLQGTTSNRNGFGSVVKVTCDGVDYHRYHSGVNIFGQSIKPVHFGLSTHSHVDDIEVKWPDGLTESFGRTSANQMVTLVQGEGEPVKSEVVLGMPTDLDEKVEIYPNPFEDDFTVQVDFNFVGKVKFSLMDVMGRTEIYREFNSTDQNNILRFDMLNHNLSSGIYIYRLTGQEFDIKGRILKN
jgi:hypothetical protein